MTEVDWIIIAECPGEHAATGDHVVYHTQGMEKYNNGLELEFNFPMAPQQVKSVMNIICLAIKEKTIEPSNGYIDTSLFTGLLQFKVIAPPIYSKAQSIMRMAISDPQGYLPDDPQCAAVYKDQFKLYKRY